PKLVPTITKTYKTASVPINDSTSLTFHVANPNSSLSLNGIGFTDTLPIRQEISTPNGLTNSYNKRAITANAGANSLNLSKTSLSANPSCTFSVNVKVTAAGTQNNVTTAITSTEAGNGGTASASLTVVGPSQQPPPPTDITPI